MDKFTYDTYKRLGFHMIKIGEGKIINQGLVDNIKNRWRVSNKWDNDSIYATLPPIGLTILVVNSNDEVAMRSLARLREYTGLDLLPSIKVSEGSSYIFIKTVSVFKGFHEEYEGISILGYKKDIDECPTYTMGGDQVVNIGGKDYKYDMVSGMSFYIYDDDLLTLHYFLDGVQKKSYYPPTEDLGLSNDPRPTLF